MYTPAIKFRPQLNVINEYQIQQIHQATLEVLERTGIEIAHPHALEILHGAGARVEGTRVRIPSWLVDDALKKAPTRVVLGDRHGERKVFLEGDKSWYGPSLDCVDYLGAPSSHVPCECIGCWGRSPVCCCLGVFSPKAESC